MMRAVIASLAVLAFGPGAVFGAEPGFGSAVESARGMDVVIVGEVHDNPSHHIVQAKVAEAISPRAVVFEMLRPADIPILAAHDTADAASEALGWSDRGWPAFTHYHQIIVAAEGAVIFGADLPRSDIQAAISSSAGAVFSGDPVRYGLDQKLDPAQQSAREERQLAAHCDALPAEMLPGMVEVQRLRDAALAEAVVQATDLPGSGPVLVIAGNGHADREWGVPAALAHAAPELSVYVIQQTEAPETEVRADSVLVAAPVERPDPCLAFKSN